MAISRMIQESVQIYYTDIENSSVLKVGKSGKIAFQFIVASEKDVVVDRVEGKGLTCLSVEGTDADGKDFRKEMPVEGGKPWSFWCLADGEALTGCDVLEVKVGFTDGQEFILTIPIEVSEEYNHSLDDMYSLTRLQWLNSREGFEETVTQGFLPVAVEGRTVKILGRDITISEQGFLESIKTYFVGNNSKFSEDARELLAAPVEYEVFEDGKKLEFSSDACSITRDSDVSCSWQAVSHNGDLQMIVSGQLDFDGSVRICAKFGNMGRSKCLSGAKCSSGMVESGSGMAESSRKISVRLTHKPRPEFAKYFMGLGMQGQKFPESHTWKWDLEKHQDSLWSGSVNGGLYICPTDEKEAHPLVNIYFRHGERNQPVAWVNDGKGYFMLEGGETPKLYYDSGEFAADEGRTFCANFLVTPFKKIDLKKRWNTHYYHRHTDRGYRQADVEDAYANGCSHLNLHHGNEIYPYINYPMYDVEALGKIIDAAHEKGLGFKTYYTIRELTTRLPELAAFRSLRDEIYPKPKDMDFQGIPWQRGVDPYITENFGDEVIPAWCHTFKEGKYAGTTDPSVITNPHSRLSNFYVASIAYLVQKLGLDGLYLDDVGYDKKVLRRVRRVFEKYRGSAEIDFHTWNHFEDDLGAGFGHTTLIYMNLFPYVDSLWVGEGYDYSRSSAEYLMTEVSGLPFGLTSELLERDCNVWRGMLYGITGRYPYYKYYKGPNPVPVWEMRKPFEDAEMIGYWEDRKPIWADKTDVLCTTYFDKEHNRMLCCFANFGEGEATFKLCGEELEGRTVYAPFIEGVQKEQHFAITDKFTVDKIGGIMLIIE